MNRKDMIKRIRERETAWDFIVVGGGATGVGTALDAASRGYQTLLLEQGDFGSGTSSRSTKLIHGGVRYLQQGNISLVLDSLKERGILRRNAPHLVHDLPFIVPTYDWWEGPFYGIGLKVYDLLAGKEGFGPSEILSAEETLKHLPNLEADGLRGGVIYYDGQFDDARLLINLATTAFEQGAVLLNYVKVTSLLRESDEVCGVEAVDHESGEVIRARGRVVINATGVFSDSLRRMENPDADPIMVSSQGIHIVLDGSFLPGDSAIMVPHTDDNRVLFAIPWYNSVLVGTTETPVETFLTEPVPFDHEVEFLLKHIGRYLEKDPGRGDIKSVFAGLRPLVKSGEKENTAAISRDHTLTVSRSGLLSISGGKWTTYRSMAEDTVNQAIMLAGLEPRPCHSDRLQIHGYHLNAGQFGHLAVYGSDAPEIVVIRGEKGEYGELLHPDFPTQAAEVIWAVRHEMARTVDDFLARRSRILIRDTRVSIAVAARVARLMAGELGRPDDWVTRQVHEFERLARNYMVRQ